MSLDGSALLFAVTVTVLIFGGRWAWGRWRDARAVARARADSQAWLAAQPPVVEPSEGQIAELRRRLPGLTLPALMLDADDAAPVIAGGTRIGGPVWLADGAAWPTGREGRPLEFVAQLDFATLPPLPDYPEAGLLQLFVGRDDLHGADFDAPDKGDVRLLWHPLGAIGGRLEAPRRLPGYGSPDDDGYSSSPFIDDRVRQTGVMLYGRPLSMEPMPLSWPMERLLAELDIDARSNSVDVMLEALWNARLEAGHHVGGHPTFVQHDYRLDIAYPPEAAGQPSPWRDYDRLLFQLTSRDGLQWGDVGEANVMIRRADLLARDFSRAIFWWDCS